LEYRLLVEDLHFQQALTRPTKTKRTSTDGVLPFINQVDDFDNDRVL
jgi:hypothetical protein